MSFKKIGTILKPFGLEGRLLIRLENVDAEFLRSLKNVYWGTGSEAEDVSEIVGLDEDGKKMVLNLKSITSRNMAERLRNASLFLPENSVNKKGRAPEAEHPFTGFTVRDPEGKNLGKIFRIEPYPAQDMLIVLKDEKEWMVPWVESFVVEIDVDNKILILDLPEGLLYED
jgi:16S rRNA processing protein RimM